MLCQQNLSQPNNILEVFAWIERFNKEIKQAKSVSPKPMTLKGEEAARMIEGAAFESLDTSVDSLNPEGLDRWRRG